MDRDGDGIPEMWKYFYSSNQEVMNWAPREGEETTRSTAELVRSRPFACGNILKVAHRHQGRSIYDKEKDVEDTKRSLLRQMLDNIYLGNDQKTIVGKGVNLDDMDEVEIGSYVRAADVSQVVPFPHIDTASTSLAALQYMDKIRKERAGTNIDLSAEGMPIRQGGDHTTERIMSAMEKQLAMYARNLANTMVRDAMILLHQQLRLLPGKMSFEVGDDWEETEPRLWMDRTRISVTLGMSEGERLRHLMNLDKTIAQQDIDAEKGRDGVLVDFQSMYEARVDRGRAAGLRNPEQYWVDPASDQAIKSLQEKQEQQRQMMELQMRQFEAQQQSLMAITQMQEATKRIANENDKLESQRDRILEEMKSQRKMMTDFAKIIVDAGIEVPGLTDTLEFLPQ